MQRKLRNIEIGARIQTARLRAGLTQEQLAEKIDRTTQFISTIERGVAGVSLDTLIKLRQVLPVSIDWLLTGGDSNSIVERIGEKFSHLSDTQLLAINQMADDLLCLIDATKDNGDK